MVRKSGKNRGIIKKIGENRIVGIDTASAPIYDVKNGVFCMCGVFFMLGVAWSGWQNRKIFTVESFVFQHILNILLNAQPTLGVGCFVSILFYYSLFNSVLFYKLVVFIWIRNEFGLCFPKWRRFFFQVPLFAFLLLLFVIVLSLLTLLGSLISVERNIVIFLLKIWLKR